MGGCPYLYESTGKVHCYSWKHQIKESLSFYYYLKKIAQELEIIKEFREIVEYAKEKA